MIAGRKPVAFLGVAAARAPSVTSGHHQLMCLRPLLSRSNAISARTVATRIKLAGSGVGVPSTWNWSPTGTTVDIHPPCPVLDLVEAGTRSGLPPSSQVTSIPLSKGVKTSHSNPCGSCTI